MKNKNKLAIICGILLFVSIIYLLLSVSLICTVQYGNDIYAENVEQKLDVGFEYDTYFTETDIIWLENNVSNEIIKLNVPLKIDAFDIQNNTLCVMQSNSTNYFFTIIDLANGNRNIFEITRRYRRVDSTFQIIDNNIIVLEYYNNKGFVRGYSLKGELISVGTTADENFVDLYNDRMASDSEFDENQTVKYTANNRSIYADFGDEKVKVYSNAMYYYCILFGTFVFVASLIGTILFIPLVKESEKDVSLVLGKPESKSGKIYKNNQPDDDVDYRMK